MKPAKIEWLKPLLILLIVVLAGPEFLLGAELIALVDLLGVGLFLLAHQYAVKAALKQLGQWLRNWAVPVHLLARLTRAELREVGLLNVAIPVSLFYLSWCALGYLSVMLGGLIISTAL